MTALGRLKTQSMRLRAAVLMAALIALAAHFAVTLARDGSVDAPVLAVDAALALLLLFAAYAHVHALTRERQQHVMSMLLLELTMEPRRLHEAAGRALELIVDGGLAEAGVVAIARGAEWLPVAAFGYPEGWLDSAPRVRRDGGADLPRLADPSGHPWGPPLLDVLGRRADCALVAVGDEEEPIGLLLLAGRRRGPLRDDVMLALTTRAVGAALHHAELYEAAYERERALESQSLRHREFLAALVDEVRSPLSSIAALAELATAEVGSGAGRTQLLASLAGGVERLEQLVNELLREGDDGGAALQAAPEVMDLADAIRTAEAVLRPAFMLGGQSLTVEVPAQPVTAYADPRHVEQVALNLLSHANRRTPMGGRVHVRLSRPDELTTRIEIEDSGPPVVAGERERIFDAGDVPPPAVGDYAGLGVARRLAALQRGRIWVEAIATGGARYCVELPGPSGPSARTLSDR